jgi:large subunit ribosomal protein L24
MSFRIKNGDLVQVITGEDKGSRGKVIEVDTKKNRVKVEGVNVIKRHTKPSQMDPQGGIIEKEASLHMSNVMLVDTKSDKPTRIGAKFLSDGKKVRVSAKSKELID